MQGAALAAGLVLAAIPQAAWADDFLLCDGFAPPTKKTDGMTEGTWMFGLAKATVDLRAGDIRFGENGIAACDRALADPRLMPEQWLRRAHLQQLRALHAVHASKHDLALEATRLSDELGKSDPFFLVSLGLGNKAIRALALAGLERKEEALGELDQLSRARPWSASIQRLTTMLQYKIDPAMADASFRNNVPLAPENARLLFWDAMFRADYATMIAQAPLITWDLPKKRGGWTMEGEQRRQLESIEERAEVTGALAFAFTMEGRSEEAALVMQEAAEDIAEAMALPPARPNGKPPKKRDLDEWKLRQPFAEAGKRQLDLWTQASAFVSGLPSRHPDEGFRTFTTSPFSDLPIFAAVMTRLNLTTPEQIAARDEALKQFNARIDREKLQGLALTTRQVANLLPRRLTAKMMPVMKPAGDGYFLSDTGLSRAQEGDSDIWTIRFVHKTAPIHVVEELAMYGAAMTAEREGKDSIVILSRRSAELTTTVVGNYMVGGSTYASGYEAQLRVRLVNADALPAELAGMEYRIIPAGTITADMSKRVKAGSGITIAW